MLGYILPSSGHVRLHRLWAFATFEAELTPTEHLHVLYCDVCHLAVSVCLQSDTFGAALKTLNRDDDDSSTGDDESRAG
jgi:hypothetical protein